MHTVKEAAGLTGLSEHAIRFYTNEGMVPGLTRNQYHHRLFDDTALSWLTTIRCLRECGMSIADIKHYQTLCLTGDSTIRERYDILWAQRAAAAMQLKEAQRRMQYIENKLKHCRNIIGYEPEDPQ